MSTNLQAALAPTGLKLAPLPQPQPVVSGAQAPSAMPGMAVAGMPSATMPTQDEISLSKQAYYAQVCNSESRLDLLLHPDPKQSFR